MCVCACVRARVSTLHTCTYAYYIYIYIHILCKNLYCIDTYPVCSMWKIHRHLPKNNQV